jgi:hypothetical protein
VVRDHYDGPSDFPQMPSVSSSATRAGNGGRGMSGNNRAASRTAKQAASSRRDGLASIVASTALAAAKMACRARNRFTVEGV